MSDTLPVKSKRKAPFLHSQELQCKNGCGYYGNPEWHSYCSKCYRELNQKVKPHQKHDTKATKKVSRSYSDVHETLSAGFSKFEEKKKQQSEKRSKTIKSIIKRGHTTKETIAQSPLREFQHGEVFQLGKDLSLRENASKDVYKQVQRQLEVMSKSFDKSIDEQSDLMQDFYHFMSHRCETHMYYQEMSSDQIDLLLEKTEELLMTHLHRSVFQHISSEYEEKDLALQKRIRSLNWITSQLLGSDIKENSPEVRELIDKAITDVIEMDSKLAPQEKLSCIVKCSKNIFNIINLCQGVTASADEFLPVMVYIVLKGNPPLLQSNIKYIISYSIPTRLRSGEGAYYFTNLCCAVSFIEELTAESLNLSNEEYELYLSGKAVPLGYTEQSVTGCEGLRLMFQNLSMLSELQEKQSKLISDMSLLHEDMDKFASRILNGLLSVPLNIGSKSYSVPADTDMSLVPEPLRGRIVRDIDEEEILVQLDINSHSTSTGNNTNVVMSNCDRQGVEHTTMDELHAISLVGELSSTSPCITDSIALNEPQTATNDNHTLTHESLSSQSPNQCVINLKDVDYPTELFPDIKSDVNLDLVVLEHDASHLSCDPSLSFPADPLSPESGFLDENLMLPPPLQPVVVQNVNDPNKKS